MLKQEKRSDNKLEAVEADLLEWVLAIDACVM
jgi:hypothetical protein